MYLKKVIVVRNLWNREKFFLRKLNVTYFGDRVIFPNEVLKNNITLMSGSPVEELRVTQLVTNSSVLYETLKLIFLKAL